MQPKPPAPEGAGTPIRAAVTAVAEQCFFAMVDGCDEPDMKTSAPAWLVAMVRFDDGHTSGSLACWVPPDLAQAMFDSFSGRDPSAPLPPAHEIYDLIGEFSNMVCGDWLSRSIGERSSFELSQPIVVQAPRPGNTTPRRLWVKVNDRPLAVDWYVNKSFSLLQGES
jgi:hypothetical protein